MSWLLFLFIFLFKCERSGGRGSLAMYLPWDHSSLYCPVIFPLKERERMVTNLGKGLLASWHLENAQVSDQSDRAAGRVGEFKVQTLCRIFLYIKVFNAPDQEILKLHFLILLSQLRSFWFSKNILPQITTFLLLEYPPCHNFIKIY